MKTLLSPTGSKIEGTLERVYGTALIVDESITQDADGGGYSFEWEGTTVMDWNNCETEALENERLFVDGNGEQWPESQLQFVECCVKCCTPFAEGEQDAGYDGKCRKCFKGAAEASA